MFIAVLSIFGLAAPIRGAPPVVRCEIEVDRAAPAPRVEPIRHLVADAAAIVRVRVVAPADSAAATREVRVTVLEDLKSPTAQRVPRTFAVRGALVARDDYNPLPVPYAQVRRAGLRGTCFAEEYRAGAEYLLLLAQPTPGQWTPYWAPLMPTTEQIHGADDAWVAWVRAQLAAVKR